MLGTPGKSTKAQENIVLRILAVKKLLFMSEWRSLQISRHFAAGLLVGNSCVNPNKGFAMVPRLCFASEKLLITMSFHQGCYEAL